MAVRAIWKSAPRGQPARLGMAADRPRPRPRSDQCPAAPRAMPESAPAAAPAAPAAPADDHSITLAGSADLVAEFFAYSVNTLLYQRGIYAPETFTRVSKYGMTMLVSSDEKVQAYMTSVLDQMKLWLRTGDLDRVVVVISTVAAGAVLERWAFNVQSGDKDENTDANAPGGAVAGKKGQGKIMSEIQALVRQITASVTFLPLLDEPCSFDMLIYTSRDAETPAQWEESGAKVIPDSHQVQLRSFSTSVHSVDACVAYARDEDA
jgi:mitotic spindle assembly checkpoint protein MAD2